MTDEPQPGARYRAPWADVLLLLVVAGLGCKAVAWASRARDIDLGDEGAILARAADIPTVGLPTVDWSPLYSLWDFLFVVSGAPLEEVPYRSWAALAVLLPCCVYVLARALGAGRFAALAVAGGVAATALIDVWPYSMHLAACVLALGTALAVRVPRAYGFAALALALLTATYVRPEFVYSLFALAPIAALAARRAERSAVARAALAFALGAVPLVVLLGSPFAEGGRSVIAFAQHYGYKRVTSGERSENPFGEWETFLRTDFGGAATVRAAFENNPRAFAWHVATNARRLPAALLATAAPRTDLARVREPHLLPEVPRRPRTEWLARAVVALALVWGAAGLALGVRRGAPDVDRALLGALAFALAALPAAAGALLVYPRFHYFVPLFVLGAALAAAGFRHLRLARPGLAPAPALALLACALALVVPNRMHGYCLQSKLWGAPPPVAPQSNRAVVEALRALNLPPGTACADRDRLRPFYAGLVPVPPGAACGAMVLEPHDDPGAGFLTIAVPNAPNARVAVRRDLIPTEVRP